MARRQQPPPAMAAAVVSRTRQGTREVLIGRIPAPPYQGLWAFPSGPVDDDEGPEAAVRRVLHSLLGLGVHIICGQPPFDAEWEGMVYRWRFYFCELGEQDKVHNSHFAAVRWVPNMALRDYEFDPVSQQVVEWILADSAPGRGP